MTARVVVMNLNFSEGSRTRYVQVYEYYRELIENGKLQENTRMPSIRKGAVQLGISRTTIETAYFCLAADGYIASKPQSGYYVTRRNKKPQDTPPERERIKNSAAPRDIIYNFTSNNVDEESFDFDLWRRYIKSALRQNKRMLTYGEPQGEYELRETICKYVLSKRNAVCAPENIVIGAGSQSLMNILCPLIKERRSVCFNDSGFKQGIAVFSDYGFEIVKDREQARILYLTPSNMTTLGEVMTADSRLTLLSECAKNDTLVIEDDYNNEFRYFNKPIPCLQGLAGGENVVYLSTFSKLLLPSIRLSFMILPDSLLKLYEPRRNLYNQTASKSEQLALCAFLRDGHLESQIRRLKRLYSNKAKTLSSILEREFGKNADIFMGESVFLVHMRIKCGMDTDTLFKRLKDNGILVFACGDRNKRGADEYAHIAFSCSEVPTGELENAALMIRKCIME